MRKDKVDFGDTVVVVCKYFLLDTNGETLYIDNQDFIAEIAAYLRPVKETASEMVAESGVKMENVLNALIESGKITKEDIKKAIESLEN